MHGEPYAPRRDTSDPPLDLRAAARMRAAAFAHLALVALCSGPRAGELATLTWKDTDWLAGGAR